MRFSVEGWAPEYGAPAGDDVQGDADAVVDVGAEVAAAAWAPRWPAPPARPLGPLLFVDGVRRIDAHLWIDDVGGGARHGICASYAAGAVRCDGAARLVAAEVRRGLFSTTEGAGPIRTRHGTFDPHVVDDDDPLTLALRLQGQMGELEAEVAAAAVAEGGDVDVVVVDGPLKRGQQRPGLVGYVKTHRKAYGDEVVRDVVAALAPGQRSPLLVVGERRSRWSWYLRLPCEVRHGWAGVVRLETSADQPVAEVAALADDLALTLPAYASTPHRDPRAPQNLVPVGGLERELRHRLGDPQLLLRALREAAGP